MSLTPEDMLARLFPSQSPSTWPEPLNGEYYTAGDVAMAIAAMNDEGYTFQFNAIGEVIACEPPATLDVEPEPDELLSVEQVIADHVPPGRASRDPFLSSARQFVADLRHGRERDTAAPDDAEGPYIPDNTPRNLREAIERAGFDPNHPTRRSS